MRSTPVAYGVRDDFGYREGEDVRGFTEEENKLWSNVQSMEEREAVMRKRDERRLREHKERERHAWGRTPAGQLLKQQTVRLEPAEPRELPIPEVWRENIRAPVPINKVLLFTLWTHIEAQRATPPSYAACAGKSF